MNIISTKLFTEARYVVWDGNLLMNASLPEEEKGKILSLFREAVKLEATSSGVYQGVGGKN